VSRKIITSAKSEFADHFAPKASSDHCYHDLMCLTIKEFDVHARGVANLVKTWKSQYAAVRAAWKLEDLIAEWMQLAESAKELFAYYCDHAHFPSSNATFSYFVELVDETVGCGAELGDLVRMFETEGYKVDRAEELCRDVARLQEVVEEDQFATQMAFEGGALDDWN
jgi:hypothetical protein